MTPKPCTMPEEIWAWHDKEDDDNIKCWVEPICTTGVKYIRADLVERKGE